MSIAAVKVDASEGFLTVAEAGRLLALSRPTIYAMIGRKELPAVKIGSVHRIPKRAVAAILDRALATK
jgi:excisionase family DNA binding protein